MHMSCDVGITKETEKRRGKEPHMLYCLPYEAGFDSLGLGHTAHRYVLRHVGNVVSAMFSSDSHLTCLIWMFKTPTMFGHTAVWTFGGREQECGLPLV